MQQDLKRDNVIFFTLHKCASMFIATLCVDLSERKGMIFFSPNGGDLQIDERILASEANSLQRYLDYIKKQPSYFDLVYRYLRSKRPTVNFFHFRHKWSYQSGLRWIALAKKKVLESNQALNFAKHVRTNPNAMKFCFAPVRFYVNIPSEQNFSIILHLRDPRDILVSMFYSYCYEHPGPVPGYTDYRKRIADKGIDKFVIRVAKGDHLEGDYGTGNTHLQYIGSLLKRYENYVNNLKGRPNVTFVKYEEMVTDFRSWIKKVVIPFNFSCEDKVINELVSKYFSRFKVGKENIWSHKRKITPGDYKNKLQSNTIDELNYLFKEILIKFKYGTD